MPYALDPSATWDYILEDDRTIPGPDGQPIPNPRPTVFELRPILAADAYRLEDEGAYGNAEDKTLHTRTGHIEHEVLKLGLAGVRDFYALDADGNEVPIEFATEGDSRKRGRFVVKDSFLDRLSIRHRAELARAIQVRNTITDDEKKV